MDLSGSHEVSTSDVTTTTVDAPSKKVSNKAEEAVSGGADAPE